MQYRSTTDKMLAARFDPEPYVTHKGGVETRYSREDAAAALPVSFAPRPEFIPTRDPEPFISTLGTRTSMALEGDKFWRWSPRPEYTRPEPNPILVDLRANRARQAIGTAKLARLWLGALSDGRDWERATGNRATPDQIDHARKVLTRLANMSKEA